MDHLVTAGALGATRSATAPATRGFYVRLLQFRDAGCSKMNRSTEGKGLYMRAIRSGDLWLFSKKLNVLLSCSSCQKVSWPFVADRYD
jgi:hypothetical protein